MKQSNRDLFRSHPVVPKPLEKNVFAEAYPYFPIVQAPLAQLSNSIYFADIQRPVILQAPLAKLSWYHHLALLDRVKEPAVRQFYIIMSKSLEFHQILLSISQIAYELGFEHLKMSPLEFRQSFNYLFNILSGKNFIIESMY
ncbi:MAG TPA: hypothetical protein VF008_21195 [Niastella sp.]